MTIHNDQEFKQALSELTIADQRVLAAQFVESVVYLNSDPIIKHALKLARNKMTSGSVSEENEFDAAYKSVKSLAVKTYTACGDDADWPAQAAHFIATATKACLTPMDHLGNNSGIKNNLAWKCAMQSRMAKNCEMIESDSRTIDNEAQKQYAISNDFLNL